VVAVTAGEGGGVEVGAIDAAGEGGALALGATDSAGEGGVLALVCATCSPAGVAGAAHAVRSREASRRKGARFMSFAPPAASRTAGAGFVPPAASRTAGAGFASASARALPDHPVALRCRVRIVIEKRTGLGRQRLGRR